MKTAVEHVVRNRSRGGAVVVVVVVADIHIDPEKDSADGVVARVEGLVEAPGSSFVPCPDLTGP